MSTVPESVQKMLEQPFFQMFEEHVLKSKSVPNGQKLRNVLEVAQQEVDRLMAERSAHTSKEPSVSEQPKKERKRLRFPTKQ